MFFLFAGDTDSHGYIDRDFSKWQIRVNQSRNDYPRCEELMSRCAECEVLDSPFGRLPHVEEWFVHCFGEC